MTEARDTSDPSRSEVLVTLETRARPGGQSAWDVRGRSVGIGLDEPLGEALPRICLEQLDRAVQALHSSAVGEGVHEARKAMKRIRALLRLCRDEIGPRVYRVENVVLRDAARRISPIRDTTVMVETLEALTEQYGGSLAPGAFRALHKELTRSHQEALRASLGALDEVRAILSGARARHGSFATRTSQPPIRDDFAAVAPGLHRTYRRGRRAMEQARQHGTTAAYHEWRKRAKYLRYQIETLQPMWPEVLSPLAGAFDDLGELLGTEHDLALLVGFVGDRHESGRHLIALCSHERSLIHTRAARMGDLLYREAPGRFVSRLQAYWDAWRSG